MRLQVPPVVGGSRDRGAAAKGEGTPAAGACDALDALSAVNRPAEVAFLRRADMRRPVPEGKAVDGWQVR